MKPQLFNKGYDLQQAEDSTKQTALLENMVGPNGLEPLTSTVSIIPQPLQRLSTITITRSVHAGSGGMPYYGAYLLETLVKPCFRQGYITVYVTFSLVDIPKPGTQL